MTRLLRGRTVTLLDDLNADTVTDTQPNAGVTRATARWTTDEDAKLTRAVANTSEARQGVQDRLGRTCRADSGSNENTVLAQMA
jgi:hypothetical protein